MIKTRKLKGGITFVSEYLPYVDSASVGIWVRAGGVNEALPATDIKTAGRQAGISHFIEHMLFKGTESRNAKEIAEAIDRTGGNINAFTSKESTCYYVKTLSEHTDVSVSVLTDMFSSSLFETEEIEKEKNVVYEEMKMTEDTPEEFAQQLLDEAVFAGSALGNRVIGYPESLKTITRDDICSYMSENYVMDNTVISVMGNVDEDAVADQFEAQLSSVPTKSALRIDDHVGHSPAFISKSKDIEQSHIYLGRRGIGLTGDDYYAFTVFNSILGGSMSSRLFQKVREEKGLAYSVYSANAAYANDGLFLIYAGVGAGSEARTIEAISEEIASLAKDGTDEDELSKAREQNKGSYIFSRENISSRMYSAGKNVLLLGRTVSAEEVISGIDNVSRDDIKRIAELYRDLSDYTVTIVGKNELNRDEAGL